METLINFITGWNMFFQFVFLFMCFFFIFHILYHIVVRFFNFICDSLPIIIRGWPQGTEIEFDADEESEDDNKEEK